jgi:enoyl-CoA hydratase/carnithine racemase
MGEADRPPVSYQVSGPVARITLGRPGHRNALSAAMIAGLLAAFDRARDDDTVRVVVLTGTGEQVFCAGGDLGDMARMGPRAGARPGVPAAGDGSARPGGPAAADRADGASQEAAADVAGPDLAGPDVAGPDVAGPDVAGPDVAGPDVAGPDVAGPDVAGPDVAGPDVAGPAGRDAAQADSGPVRLFTACRDIGKPVIARLAGHALGGGLGLAVSCDIGIAADDIKLGTPEINVGLWPMMIMAVLTRHLPPKQSLKLYYTGELISAARGVELGLLTEAVPRGDLDRRVDELATLIAGRSRAAVAMGRAAFFEIEPQPLRDQLSYLRDQLVALAATDDARAAIAAFLANRRPPRGG